MKPYRIDGCPYLLLKHQEFMDDLQIGSHIDADGTAYEIKHIFHDCIAINEVIMQEQNLTYRKDEIVVLSFGKYSDYSISYVVKILKDFDAEKLLIDWAADNATALTNSDKITYKKTIYRTKRNGILFVDWLNQSGYTETIKYRELNTGSHPDDVNLSE